MANCLICKSTLDICKCTCSICAQVREQCKCDEMKVTFVNTADIEDFIEDRNLDPRPEVMAYKKPKHLLALYDKSEIKEKRVGRPTKYDPDLHLDELIVFGNMGLYVISVCARWFISKDTFYEWAKVHPEFSDAFKIYVVLRDAYHLEHAQEHLASKFYQSTTWSMLARIAGTNTEERAVNLPALREAGSYTDQCRAIKIALCEGRITPKEAKFITEQVALSAKVEESTEMRKEIDEIKQALAMKS